MVKYDHQKIERKWQKIWKDNARTPTVSPERGDKGKFYVLDMFPYPSGSGLHVGHVEGYTATDIYSRFKRMQGYNVMHPMGWDAFGLPAENYAVKTGVHPKETTDTAIKTFTAQMKKMGFSYDWEREIGTHTPEYYKWTQWFFFLLYKNGLAYKAKASVNWCPSCKTVLADEQVVNGHCERCDTAIVQKELEQWFFKITDFAEDLIADLDKVDWPASTVLNQRNWIGKSEGVTLHFKVKDMDLEFEMFDSVPQTYMAQTFTVISPEHPMVYELVKGTEHEKEVMDFVARVKEKKAAGKFDFEKDMEGVFTGRYLDYTAANRELPIWVASFVVADYGTGIVNASAHDERDFAFAKKYNLPLHPVMFPEDENEAAKVRNLEYAYVKAYEGVLQEPEEFKGRKWGEARDDIISHLEKERHGRKAVNYKLRNWLVSRQRYWGAPIPIVYDPDGKEHVVPEEHLPWLLPTDVEFKPTGISPLADSKELQERTEKIFGKGWKPEVDTMDTFVCSSWYYFRFADPANEKEFTSKEALKKWLPVDLYMGGAEHTVLHLMYARFFTKVLKKLGYIDFDEPFLKLRHQGIILGEDGHKMSKSRGNVANPDEAVEEYGADSLRMYEMFLGPIADIKPWNTRNIVGLKRFLDRVWTLAQQGGEGAENSEMEILRHRTIKKVTEDIENLRYNTAIAALMEYSNGLSAESTQIAKKDREALLILLAPFAPHITEELWEKLGNSGSIHEQLWPQYDKKKVQEKKVRLILQVNGKVRDTIEVDAGIQETEAKELALRNAKVKKFLEGKEPKKIIFVPGKLVNIVI